MESEAQNEIHFIPSFLLPQERSEVCYHWLLGSNSVTFCLSGSCPVTCHWIKYCSACTGMVESNPSCLWLLVIQESLGWGRGTRYSCRIIELDSYLVWTGADILSCESGGEILIFLGRHSPSSHWSCVHPYQLIWS